MSYFEANGTGFSFAPCDVYLPRDCFRRQGLGMRTVRKGFLRFGVGLIFLAMGLIFLWQHIHRPVSPGTPTSELPLNGKRILIDVGHGGIDSGAITKEGAEEKNINLQVALVLKQALVEQGATVLLSRDTDRDLSGVEPNHRRRNHLDLTNRIRWANEVKGDLLVSLHMNSARSSRVRGGILLYHAKEPYTPQSRELAHILQKEINGFYAGYAQSGEMYRHQPITGDYYVLEHTLMPAVIIEMGFMTNPQDRALFIQPDFQKALSRRIVNGVIQFFTQKSEEGVFSQQPLFFDEDLEVKGSDSSESLATFSSQVKPAKGSARGKLAIIIDDFGNHAGGMEEILRINRPLTLAIMPFFQDSKQIAQRANSLGFEVMIHMPMETVHVPVAWYGPRYIRAGMARDQIAKILDDAKAAIPFATGVNNHMGVTVSQNEKVALSILKEVKKQQWHFVDSLTVSNSVFPRLAKEAEIPFLQRDVFIDHSGGINEAKRQLFLAGKVALKYGKAVAIGHVGGQGKSTAQAIREMVAPLEEMGVDFVFVSDLLYTQ